METDTSTPVRRDQKVIHPPTEAICTVKDIARIGDQWVAIITHPEWGDMLAFADKLVPVASEGREEAVPARPAEQEARDWYRALRQVAKRAALPVGIPKWRRLPAWYREMLIEAMANYLRNRQDDEAP